MEAIWQAAIGNLLSPMVLAFALGFVAALLGSDLTVPEAIGKGLALYLMFAIGFKGGVAVAANGLDMGLVGAALAGIALSFLIPFIAFQFLRWTSQLDRPTAAAVSAHYGSISVVTFVAASEFLRAAGATYAGYMVAVVALMETPAIVSGLFLARERGPATRHRSELLREILLNGSVVLLLGAFVIGLITGAKGEEALKPFVGDLFKGALCLFLLDMGLLAARGLKNAPPLGGKVFLFGLYMPLVSASLALAAALLLQMDVGSGAVLMVLTASASYIAVPAAMRLALPKANPAVYLSLSLGVTFPFNVAIGIPLYFAVAERVLSP